MPACHSECRIETPKGRVSGDFGTLKAKTKGGTFHEFQKKKKALLPPPLQTNEAIRQPRWGRGGRGLEC